MAVDRDLYDGVFYCRFCGRPLHIFLILKTQERCECGSKGFMSNTDFDIIKTLARTREMIEEEGIRIS